MSRWSVRILLGGIAFVASLGVGAAEAPIPLADVAHIHGVGFDPKDPSRVLLATHHGIFVALADGTASRISETRDDFMGFTTVPGRQDLLVASGHPEVRVDEGSANLGFIQSDDGGANWRLLSTGEMGPVDFHALTVSRANPAILYGLYGGIQASHDGGQTWATVGPGPERVVDLAASAVDVDTLFAATGAGLHRSSDGGRSWSLLGPASPVTMVETGADGSLFVFFAGVGLYMASADATDWSAVNEELAGREFLHMASEPGVSSHLVAVTHTSEVLESHDGGVTWKSYGSSSQ